MVRPHVGTSEQHPRLGQSPLNKDDQRLAGERLDDDLGRQQLLGESQRALQRRGGIVPVAGGARVQPSCASAGGDGTQPLSPMCTSPEATETDTTFVDVGSVGTSIVVVPESVCASTL